MLVGISEAIRLFLTLYKYLFRFKDFCCFFKNKRESFSLLQSNEKILIRKKHNHSLNWDTFNECLAGLIDWDGCFLLSKKGYASLEITIQLRDVRCLNVIKQKYGGSIKIRANQNHLRYRLHHKKGLLKLIGDVNGLIRNPIRIIQLAKICDKYSIFFSYPEELVYNNGWLSGFFDSDGSVYINIISTQINITVGQKNKLILDNLAKIYGGSVYISKGKEHFKWIVYRKKEVLDLLDYFNIYKPRSGKLARINMIPKCYELYKLGAHKAPENTVLGKAWKQFKIKWDNFS